MPPEWIVAIFPGVNRLLETVQARNARVQSGKQSAKDLISDKAAEGFLQTVLYCGVCFWQKIPFRTQKVTVRWPVMTGQTSNVSPAMGDMLTEMQGCLKQLCGNSVVRDPQAVA